MERRDADKSLLYLFLTLEMEDLERNKVDV